jgi:hypothetical protein
MVDRIWLAETWKMIERTANHDDCKGAVCARVSLSADGCSALLVERNEMTQELAELRAELSLIRGTKVSEERH